MPAYRPFGPPVRFSHLTTRSRAWLPSNSSQNSLFCKLLLQQVTAPAFGGRGPLPTSGASRLVSMPSRSMHEVPDHFQASLEEVRFNRPDLLVTESCDTWERRPEGPPVSRPGRKAGKLNGQNLERRRRGTGIMRAGSDAPIFSQLRRGAARGGHRTYSMPRRLMFRRAASVM